MAQAFNPVFLDSPFGCRCLTLALATISTTTPVTPKSWKSASPYSRGLYAISAAPLRVIRDFILASPALFFAPAVQVLILLLLLLIGILYRTMGCKPRADLYPSPCLSRREDPPSGRRNTQCVTTAAVTVGAVSRFLPRWAGRGFWDLMQV